jgi:hypothetical protein
MNMVPRNTKKNPTLKGWLQNQNITALLAFGAQQLASFIGD